jgi:hypothetical protein
MNTKFVMNSYRGVGSVMASGMQNTVLGVGSAEAERDAAKRSGASDWVCVAQVLKTARLGAAALIEYSRLGSPVRKEASARAREK